MSTLQILSLLRLTEVHSSYVVSAYKTKLMLLFPQRMKGLRLHNFFVFCILRIEDTIQLYFIRYDYEYVLSPQLLCRSIPVSMFSRGSAIEII